VSRWLLDSSALLVLLRAEPGASRIQEILANATEVLIAAVSIAEISRRAKELGASSAEITEMIDQCKALATRFIDITVAIAELSFAISSAASKRLPLVDALIAACAAHEQASLLHRDQHFSGIPTDLLMQEQLIS
jgi:predicted nucleic acid-binding protein